MSDQDSRERFKRSYPCPICGGWNSMERGEGKRCYGYTYINDGTRFAVCTREEHAGDAKYHEGSGGYIHRLDITPPHSGAHRGHSDHLDATPAREVARYDYRDESGALLFQAVRYAPKEFSQGHHDAAGTWVSSIEGVRRVHYRLPELLAAEPAAMVFIPEGEKDVDALRALGFVATCNPMGAGKWRNEYNEHLRGRHVVILPDNDPAGADHARKVANALMGIAESVKVLGLPGLPTKGDVSDWLADGGSAERLTALADATPEYLASEHISSEDTGDGWTAKITLLADVQPEDVRWLWPGYIPLGKLTVLDGDPGNGKSTLMCDLAARLSTGRAMPDGSASDLDGPAGVVLLSAEDGPADTIRPRLDAAGADVRRIALLECVVSGKRERGITLADLDHIKAAIAAVDARLVIIDPLMAYLDSATNSYRDQDVRGVLAPLARLADRTGAAVVIIRHLSKGQTSNVLYRGGGSVGIIAAARVGLIVGPDPDDPDGPHRVLAVAKSNLAIKPPALAYRLTEAANGVAAVAWEGATHHTAAMLTGPQTDDEERNAQTDAASVLKDILGDGPVPADDVKAQAKRAGIAERTLWRAKAKLGIHARKDGYGDGARWLWEIPPSATDDEEDRSVPKDAEGCQSNGMADFAESGILRRTGGSSPAPSHEEVAAYLRGVIATHDAGDDVPRDLPGHISRAIAADPYGFPAVGARSAYGYALFWFREQEGDAA